MKVAFNGRVFGTDKLRGFARYTLEVIRALKNLNDGPEVVVVTNQKIDPFFIDALGDTEIIFNRVRPYLLYESVFLPQILRKNEIDIYHSTNNKGLPLIQFPPTKMVLTLHDAMEYEEVMKDGNFWSQTLYQYYSKAFLNAEAVITVSEFSKKKIEQNFPYLEAYLHVIYNGISDKFSSGTERNNNELLYVGGFEERKNVDGLLISFKELKENDEFKDLKLTLVGDTKGADKHILNLGSSIAGVEFTGFISDEELIQKYQKAGLVVIPSWEEGFGLQVVEAMACGAPVLLSNRSSLPEVGGDAAVYFDPAISGDLCEKLSFLMRNQETRERQINIGIERAKKFSWAKAAQELNELYHSLLD